MSSYFRKRAVAQSLIVAALLFYAFTIPVFASCGWLTVSQQCSPDPDSRGAGCELLAGCYCGPPTYASDTSRTVRCRSWCLVPGQPCSPDCPYALYDVIEVWQSDPNDPCCGSSDPCCGTTGPCCDNSDPCCGNSDPCCGDVCCGEPDCGRTPPPDTTEPPNTTDPPETNTTNPPAPEVTSPPTPDTAAPEPPDTTPTTPDDSPCGNGGKPISLVSGAEILTRTDLVLGKLFPIIVERNYNSRSTYNSPVGYGWALNYDKRIYTYPDGSVTLRKECGRKGRFIISGGTFTTPAGEDGTLVKNADGTFTFIDIYGTREEYDTLGRIVKTTAPNGNSQVFSYSPGSREPLWGLLPVNIGQSNSLIVSYDYRLSKIEEKNASGGPTGNWVEFHYDSTTGWLSEIWDSLGRSVTYSHDNIGNLIAVSGPGGNATYSYEDPVNSHYLTGINHGQGLYANTYDAKGRVIKQTHATGVIDFEYTNPRKMTTTIKNDTDQFLTAKTRSVEFDINGQPAKVKDSLGNVMIFAHNAQFRMTREEFWENTGSVSAPTLVFKSSNEYAYDLYGNVKTKTEGSGSSIAKTTAYLYNYEIDPLSPAAISNKPVKKSVKSVVFPLDSTKERVTTYNYDNTTGNLLSISEAGFLGDGTAYSYTTTYDYDPNGKLKSIDGPRTDVQDVITFGYDVTTGYLTSVTQPLIGTTTFSNPDPLGIPQMVIDPNGNSLTYTYDTLGRVTNFKAPGDTAPTQIFYVSSLCTTCNGVNKIDHIILPEGSRVDFEYDLFGNLIKIIDSDGNSINYTYDSEGKPLAQNIKDASGLLQKALSYSYDALSRLSVITNPDSSYAQYGYDSLDNRKSITNPKGNITTYDFDVLNRLTTVHQPGNINTTFGYNANNNLTTVTDANGSITSYKYDDRGRVYQLISPDTGTATYSYDPAGNMVSKTDAKNITIFYSYDALNRLMKIDFPADTDTIYSYDNCPNGKGRLCSMSDASGTTMYEYSAKGLVTEETKTIDGITYVTQYTYDMNGNIKTMTYPGGRVITYSYSNDRVASVKNNDDLLASSITYAPFGDLKMITYGNGATGTISYDNQYRPFDINIMRSGVGIMHYSYRYDNNGNITTITDNLDSTKNKTFAYDTLDRLWTATATGLWSSIGWAYDGVGNRKIQTSSAGKGNYLYLTGTNKLASITGTGAASFTFDPNGNTASENTREFIYSQNQRLIQVNDGAMTANYTYNGNGQRVKKNVNGVVTVFHYSLSGQIIAESNSAGSVTAEYIYLNGRPLSKIEGSMVCYYHNDHLATPQKMTDSSGAVVWSADYKPFGEATVAQSSTVTNNLRFLGQYYDAETGLHDNYTRSYSPPLGRYAQADRIGLYGGMNPYTYVGNKPLRYIDPKGKSGYSLITLLHWGLHAYHVYDFVHLLYGNDIYAEDEWVRNRDREDLYNRIDQLEQDIQDTSNRLDEQIRDLERRQQWERDNGLRPPCR